ncbi:hypothetical protein BDV3_006126 [Batrachochytrium dendrobatidis]|nr:hypothetical protein QVD99_006648 [Batrachochytrium dendrobatidis]
MSATKVADVLHKIVGGSLFVFTVFGAFNMVNMFIYKNRRANLAEQLLQEETADVFAAHYSPAIESSVPSSQ